MASKFLGGSQKVKKMLISEIQEYAALMLRLVFQGRVGGKKSLRNRVKRIHFFIFPYGRDPIWEESGMGRVPYGRSPIW